MCEPAILFYCQHVLGMGHLVRSLALARALAGRFRVVFLNGGAVPRGLRRPAGIEFVDLPPLGFDATGRPQTWPMRLTKVHWAISLPGLSPGEYTLRSRTVDEKGIAQPLPRPFRKSGHAAIESVSIKVKP